MVIAVIAPAQPAAFFDLLWDGVWEATLDVSPFGVAVQSRITDRSDLAAQRAILASLRGEQIDAIALVPSHATGLNPLIDDYIERGIPVITFHSDAPASRRTLFVGPDALQAGVLAGEVLVKLMGGRGRLLSFPGLGGEHHLAQRYEGLRLELSRHQEVSEVTCAFDASSPESVAAAIRRQPGPIDGVYICSDQAAGVAEGLELMGIQAPCVGFTNTESARPYLERRTISAIIDESRYQQGYFAVQKAYESILKRGESVPKSVLMPSTVIFSSNMRDTAGGQPLNEAFEGLVLQRTTTLRTYQQMLEGANRKLEGLATTDPLTGLMNRRKFDEILDQEVARALRYGRLSLLMIDLNWFKMVNDQFGHQAGDAALQAVAKALRSRCRSTDACARLGGDEFALILPNTEAPGAAVVRDSISSLVEEIRLAVGDERIGLSVSIGIATLPDEASTAQRLMAVADADMYRTKAAMKMVSS